MSTAIATQAPSRGIVVRKPLTIRQKENYALLGLLGLTLLTGFCGSKSAHLAVGLALTGAVGYHVWQRRKSL